MLVPKNSPSYYIHNQSSITMRIRHRWHPDSVRHLLFHRVCAAEICLCTFRSHTKQDNDCHCGGAAFPCELHLLIRSWQVCHEEHCSAIGCSSHLEQWSCPLFRSAHANPARRHRCVTAELSRAGRGYRKIPEKIPESAWQHIMQSKMR